MSYPTKILIVDSNEDQARELATQLAAGTEAIGALIVKDAAGVAAQVEAGACHAAVLDVDSVPDAAAAAKAIRERLPDAPIVCIGTRFDSARMSEALRIGARAVLAKPYDAGSLLRVLSSPAVVDAFGGTASGMSTSAMLAAHCSAGHDGIFYFRAEVDGQLRVGCIYLEGGQPVHAQAGDLVGAPAVQAIISWRDATAKWVPGQGGCVRTVVGHWEGLLARPWAGQYSDASAPLDESVAVTYPEVVEKRSRLAQTPDILGAFLLQHADVVAGRCIENLDEPMIYRALSRLAHVFHDVDAQPKEETATEIQATIGQLRLVLDTVGPPEAGFQVGVVVRQASPVCKSLRRLLRQIDKTFHRAMARRRKQGPSVGVGSRQVA